MGRLGLLCCMVVLISCRLVLLSGPSQVSVGDDATYVLEVASSEFAVSGDFLHLFADVPSGWTLRSSTYTGTANGMPVSGSGTLGTASFCDAGMPALQPGFQRLRLTAGPFSATDQDTGTVTLRFLVGSQPDGAFDLVFVFGGQGTLSECSLPVIRTINRPSPFLERSQLLFDLGAGNPDLLHGPNSIALSPDGDHAYTSNGDANSIVTFSRNLETGALTYLEAHVQGQGGVTGLCSVTSARLSPDGAHLYARSACVPQISIFSRDPTTDLLTFLGTRATASPSSSVDFSDLVISPDGLFLSTAGHSAFGIATYSRDVVSGTLTLVQDLHPAGAGAPSALIYSPDGLHVYATSLSNNSIQTYSRDPVSGELTFIEELVASGGPPLDEFAAPRHLAISPDGRTIYVTAQLAPSGALYAFTRNLANGALSFLESHIEGVEGVVGLGGPRAVAVSRGGTEVFVAGWKGVTVFHRSATGQLSPAERHQEGIFNLGTAILSPKDDSFYAMTPFDRYIVTFKALSGIFFDGFESGDLSGWSLSN